MLRQKKKNEKEDRKVIAYFKRINRKTEKTDNEDEVKQTYRQKKKKRRRKRRRRREGKELVLHIHRNIYTSFLPQETISSMTAYKTQMNTYIIKRRFSLTLLIFESST